MVIQLVLLPMTVFYFLRVLKRELTLSRCVAKETFHSFSCKISLDLWLVKNSKVKVLQSMEQRWSAQSQQPMCQRLQPLLVRVMELEIMACAVEHTVQDSFTCFHLPKFQLWAVSKLLRSSAWSSIKIKETRQKSRNSRMESRRDTKIKEVPTTQQANSGTMVSSRLTTSEEYSDSVSLHHLTPKSRKLKQAFTECDQIFSL